MKREITPNRFSTKPGSGSNKSHGRQILNPVEIEVEENMGLLAITVPAPGFYALDLISKSILLRMLLKSMLDSGTDEQLAMAMACEEALQANATKEIMS